MGLFDRRKKGACTICSPVSGEVVKMEDIADEVFREGVLGFCCGVEPESGEILSPCDGRVTQLSETLHAVGLEDENGAEILVHIGIDTVELGGEGFSSEVKAGASVKKGQLLIRADIEKIRAAGYHATVVTALTNSGEYGEVRLCAEGQIAAGEKMIEVRR